MGYTQQSSVPQQPYVPNTFVPDNSNPIAYNYNDQSQISSNQSHVFTAPTQQQTANNYYDPYNTAPNYLPQTQQFPSTPAAPSAPVIFDPNATIPPNNFPTQFSMLQQPIVQDMAIQYGQRLADQGKQMVETQFEKYVPVTRLKYYFAVDNNYVVKKLFLLFFPFTHKVRLLPHKLEFMHTNRRYILMLIHNSNSSNSCEF